MNKRSKNTFRVTHKRSKNTFRVTSIALTLVPLGTRLFELLAQFLIGSPGTLLPSPFDEEMVTNQLYRIVGGISSQIRQRWSSRYG